MNIVLIVCGAIVTIAGAIAAIGKWIVKPINSIVDKLEKVDKMEECQKMIMKSQSDILQHIITGNHIDILKDDYDNMVNYLIEKK